MEESFTGWSRNRWLATILFLFILHVVALKLLKIRPAVAMTPTEAKMDVRILRGQSEEELVKSSLRTDPTLFVLANARSFSGVGWLGSGQTSPELPDWIAPSAFLPYTPVPVPIAPTDEGRFLLSKLSDPPFQAPFKALMAGEVVGTNSAMSLRGGITNLNLVTVPSLRSFPATALSSNTVVEISADRDGQVVLARLLVKSGIPTADNFGLASAAKLVFEPPSRAMFKGNELISGTVIFHWKTYYSTNAPAEVSP
jgi:hypothetical protein